MMFNVDVGTFPRRAMVISFLFPVLALLLVGGIGAGILISWHGHDSAARTEVTGRGDALGDYESGRAEGLDVYWKDPGGAGHEIRYRVPEGTVLKQSQPFRIRYDPDDVEGLVFPAGAEARLVIAPQPPWWVLFFAAPFLLIIAGVALGWWLRLRAARDAAGTPGETYRVVPIVSWGTMASGASVRHVPIAVGLMLMPRGEPFDEDDYRAGRELPRPANLKLQKVMWNPAFARLIPGQELIVHLGANGRAVVRTADGTVWPVGRAKAKWPRRVTVASRTPVNSRIRPSKAYLLAPLAGIILAPFAFMSVAGLLVLPFALLLSYCVTSLLWAWRSGLPADATY
jgi:hypothetical protein